MLLFAVYSSSKTFLTNNSLSRA